MRLVNWHLTGLDEVMVVVVHCLPDLLGTVSIHSCQISTKLVNALFCHTLAYTQSSSSITSQGFSAHIKLDVRRTA